MKEDVKDEVSMNPTTISKRNTNSAGAHVTWIEEIDEASGCTYYVNSLTGKSQWEQPDVLQRSAQGKTLPWRKFIDEESGKLYFANLDTGQTQWARPEGFVEEDDNRLRVQSHFNDSVDGMKRSPSAESFGIDKCNSSGESDDSPVEEAVNPLYKFNKLQNQKARNQNIQGNASEDISKVVLRTGKKRGSWEEVVEEETGATYYYNTKSGQIQRNKPGKWVKMLARRFNSDNQSDVEE